MMKSIFAMFVLSMCSLTAGAQDATPVALCRKGALPKTYQGIYRSSASNSDYTLTAKRLFVGGGYFDVSSCMVEDRRILTLTDNNPSTTQNFIIERQGSDLVMTDINTSEAGTLTFIRR